MLVLLSSVCGSICGAISWLAAEGEAHVLVVTGAVSILLFQFEKRNRNKYLFAKYYGKYLQTTVSIRLPKMFT